MRFPSILIALAVLAPGPAQAGPFDGVTACDLRRLTAFYGTRGKAKRAVRALARDSKIVDTPRGPMAEGVYYEVEATWKIPAECTFAEAGYGYDDALVLARVWGTDPAGAKAIVEEKIAIGAEYVVRWALEEAYAGEGWEPPNPDEAALEAFFAGERFTYCDARLLAAHWQIDLFTAKVAIGTKIRARQEDALEASLRPARYEASARGDTCAFWETGYDYGDAERLAALWRVDVPTAKARVGAMVMRGENPVLRQMLRHGG